MKTKTVQVNEGEYLGPVDWSYDFAQHFNNSSQQERDQRCEEGKELLRKLADGSDWEATTDGGMPRCGWGKVLQVGMYDGWPYWRPVPSVLIWGWLGSSWHWFGSVSDIRPVKS